MIIVTGGAGMIGSNLIRKLNNIGYCDILVVDNLEDGKKFSNLVNVNFKDYIDKDDFLLYAKNNKEFGNVEAIFHQGACSSTTNWDGKYMLKNNYDYSKHLIHYSIDRKIPFIYASSAATYGLTNVFVEEKKYEGALNVYGYSKQLFDNYVRDLWVEAKKKGNKFSQITGLRYFNVYGPNESHKGSMASVAYHLNKQINSGENLKLFKGSNKFKRDFIYVDDLCEVNLWFLKNSISGIFNCGTGRAESFEAVANAIINYYGKGKIEYIPFPNHLNGSYQSYTQADLNNLRNSGCDVEFRSVAEGVCDYLKILGAK